MICYDCMNAILKLRFPLFTTLEIQDLLDSDDKCIETGQVSFDGVWSFLNKKYHKNKRESFRILHEAFEDWFYQFTNHCEFRTCKSQFWKQFDPKTITHRECQVEFAKMNSPK